MESALSILLVKDRRHFRLIGYHADYLNPEEDEAEGIVHLVNKSIQTTRRFDALKLFVEMPSVFDKKSAAADRLIKLLVEVDADGVGPVDTGQFIAAGSAQNQRPSIRAII